MRSSLSKLAWGIGAVVLGGSGVLALATVILGASFLFLGKVISEVPIAATPTTTPIVFVGGRRVQLTLHVAEIDASNACKRLAVDIQMMHAGHAFQSYENVGYSLSKGSERQQTNTTMSVETLELPSGGLDQIRMSYRFEPPDCGGKVDGLVLQFREPRF